MQRLPAADRARLAEACARLGLVDASITLLEGGSRNRSYRLRSGQREVVLRVEGERDEAYGVVRAAEHAAQRLAAAHGLAPRLLLTGTGYAATEFVDAPPWSREQAASAQGARRAGAWLARLHALPVPAGLRQARFLCNLEGYADRLRGGAGEWLVPAARQLARDLGEFTPVLCHNDLHHLNLIDAPRGLVAVDWEYAGAGDPRMDLAGYIAYHDLEEAAVAALLDGYGPRGAAWSRAELERARWLFEAVWWAWLALRQQLEHHETAELQAVRRRLWRRLEDGQPSR